MGGGNWGTGVRGEKEDGLRAWYVTQVLGLCAGALSAEEARSDVYGNR